jgi:acid phosphatase (class A)
MRAARLGLLAAPILLCGLLGMGADTAGAREETPRGGYLAKGAYDPLPLLPAPPQAGSPAAAEDLRIFRETRRLEGGPRWALAKADDEAVKIGERFGCAVGAEATPKTAPRLTALLRRVGADLRPAVDRAKDHFDRKRPYLSEPGPICLVRSPFLAASPDYPSGHASWGWTVGLVLATLAPDRAEPILARARAYGESRVVCGVHTASAVSAAQANAEGLVAALKADAAFQADLAAARAELDALRAASPAPDTARCDAEAALAAQPLL